MLRPSPFIESDVREEAPDFPIPHTPHEERS
jgi:hypothetical protein